MFNGRYVFCAGRRATGAVDATGARRQTNPAIGPTAYSAAILLKIVVMRQKRRINPRLSGITFGRGAQRKTSECDGHWPRPETGINLCGYDKTARG